MNKHETGQVAASAAEIYEAFFVPALFAEWPPRVLQAAAVAQGHSVLDVACGTGILAREAARYVGSRGEVVGVDINVDMLTVAKQQTPSISWKMAPAEDLPFASNTFDRVVSQFGLMFFDDSVQALKEMRRVLQPEGKIAVAVWGPLAATPGYAVVAEILTDLFGADVARSIEAPYSLGDRKMLTALFAEADMAEIQIQTVTGKVRFDSVESWIYTDIKGWTLADVIDDEGYERLRQYAPERLSQFVQADSSVMFEAPAHIVTV